MAGPDSGGGDIGARLHAQGIGGGGSGPTNKDAPPEDIFDFITKLIEKTGTWITKFTGVNVESFFNTGAMPVKLEQGGIQVNNQIMRQAIIPDASGGALASIAGMLINQKNFGNLTAPAIEGLPVSEMNMANASFSDLGGLIPGPAGLPNNMGGMGMDLGGMTA
jgi:hypothetical protein